MLRALYSSFQQGYFIDLKTPKTVPAKTQVHGQLNHGHTVQEDDLHPEIRGGEEEECDTIMIYLFQKRRHDRCLSCVFLDNKVLCIYLIDVVVSYVRFETHLPTPS